MVRRSETLEKWSGIAKMGRACAGFWTALLPLVDNSTIETFVGLPRVLLGQGVGRGDQISMGAHSRHSLVASATINIHGVRILCYEYAEW